MNTVLRIALRNVIRHRRRALITAITMMVGIGFFIALDSLYNGLDRLSVDDLINYRDSSVKIYSAAYDADRESYPLDKGIADVGAVESWLKSDKRVVAAAPRTQFLAQAGNYRDSLYVVGTVVDPAMDSQVFALKNVLIGSYFTPQAGTDRQIILGKELADRLGLKIGDTVLIAASTRYEAQNADDFTIIGLLSTSDPTLNKSTAMITYDAANDFLDLGGLATEIDVRLRHRVNLSDTLADAASVAAGVKAAFPSLEPYSFQDLNKGFLTVLKQKRIWGYVIMLFILLLSAVGIVNTVLMSVYERIREVGVLKALGFRGREVVRMFVLEGFFVGCLGSLLGAALGILINCYTIYVGFNMQKFGDVGGGFAFWGTLRGEWNPGAILFAVIFGMVLAVLAAAIPARSAARMTATSALRFV
jgi:ABC-type lipoprotein release transport system permease subunit